ncbi:MAG: GntR family transcriptional regulator, partial [Bdellovibrio sp.]|nr:GntR family transcriptional regulator [Bdellovibrio sp.]
MTKKKWTEGPIYLQIAEEILKMIARGELHPGEKIPSTRTLAETWIVYPNTIVSALFELEQKKILESRRGLGNFICENISIENVKKEL